MNRVWWFERLPPYQRYTAVSLGAQFSGFVPESNCEGRSLTSYSLEVAYSLLSAACFVPVTWPVSSVATLQPILSHPTFGIATRNKHSNPVEYPDEDPVTESAKGSATIWI